MSETKHLRPAAHFTARDTWLNDPNGLILHKGVYHLFFQHNPNGQSWGDIGWGHATSTDLIRWEEQPPAIPATSHEMAFSGSVVWDRFNTSGLGSGPEGPLVAVFTSACNDTHPTHPGLQVQSIAVSDDDGATWRRHDGNPVLDRGSKDFRDPKVFRHEPSGRWVMVAVEAADRQVVIHSSANLIDWRFESAFGPAGQPDLLWECPDLVEVPVEGGGTRWVLLLSINPGGFAGGSGMVYFVGDFDGHTFVADPSEPHVLDFGPDYYAAVSFSGTPRATILGWFSNWAYALEAPTWPWRSAMTLARTVSLAHTDDGLRLRAVPVADELPGAVTRATATLGVGEEIVVWTGDDDRASRVVIRREADGSLVVDRGEADPSGVHEGIHATPPIPLPNRPVEVDLIVDAGLIELYLDGGLVTVSMQTFPVPGPVRVEGGEPAHQVETRRPMPT